MEEREIQTTVNRKRRLSNDISDNEPDSSKTIFFPIFTPNEPNLSSTNNHHKLKMINKNEETSNKPGISESNGFNVRTSVGGAKKLVIKNLRTTSNAAPKIALDGTGGLWEPLHESILAIQQSRSVNNSLEQLYQNVVNACGAGHAAALYKHLQADVNAHVMSLVPELLKKRFSDPATANSQSPTSTYLNAVHTVWTSHCQHMLMIRSIFLYMDRTYVLQNTGVSSIWDMGLTEFRHCIIDTIDLRCKTVDCMLSMIHAERNGAVVDRSMLFDLTKMLVALQAYESAFEKSFLDATNIFYENESKTKMAEFDASITRFIRHIQLRLNEESERAHRYLDEGRTKKQLTTIVENQLIATHSKYIVKNGLEPIMNEKSYDDISLMFNLLSRVQDGRLLFRQNFADYIKKHGRALVMNVDGEKTMVIDLLAFKKKMQTIVTKCCADDTQRFTDTVKDAFSVFINQRQNKPAEMIAKYMDQKLRLGNKELSDDELDKMMDDVITLFRFVHGKDVFEAFYKKDLAKRLLLGKSASVDAEKSMLSKLKQECGPSFTSKLEGMFRDIELSREMDKPFKNFVQHVQDGRPIVIEEKKKDSNGKTNEKSDGPVLPPLVSLDWPNVDMTVSVLTMGNWPNYPIANVTQPMQINQFQNTFEHFYKSKHQGRRLTWVHSLGQVVMKTRFSNQEKELLLSHFQALVLLLFNERDTLCYKDIQNETNIETIELKRTLQSLACGKIRVLIKNPKGKDIDMNDSFTITQLINDQRYRIKINQVQQKETEEEHQMTEEQVNSDRQYAIDAAVVRIMKARKQLQHNLLIAELVSQLRFPTKPSDLKKRIESLIERDYLVRDKEDANVYHYVA